MDQFEFDWEVLDIVNADGGERGARVKYTPLAEGCSECTIFVRIPWHKATGVDHAREMMERKIASRAPIGAWRNELVPPVEDQSEAIAEELSQSLPKGEKREARPEPEGSDDDDSVHESGRAEGE